MFAEAFHRTSLDRLLLMLGEIRDHHHRDSAQLRVRLQLVNDLDAVAIVDIELAIDQHQIERLFAQLFASVLPLIGRHHLGIEVRCDQLHNSSVIGNAVSNVEHSFRHTAGSLLRRHLDGKQVRASRNE